jgi:tetratricopeptide (TPR) repeat protein/serine/threonine protein kinase
MAATNNARDIFLDALDRAPADRAAYLDLACGDDAAMRHRVEALLRAHDDPRAFLSEVKPGVSDADCGGVEVPLRPNDAAPLLVAGGATVDSESGQPETDHADPTARVGAVLAGKYKLVEEIGEGGMGSVFMAQQTEPVKRAVAVKVIKAGMDSKAVLARFDAERQALAMMDHPNIAKVLDAGTTDGGRPFFVMELVKGTPITRYCDEHKLTPRQRLELFVPVCQAIQHAHQKGIIHRDIKPSNVLVALYDDRPVPKVIDFGLAKAAGQTLTDKTLMTGFGALVGTPEYMSPEQASLNNLDIDTRSDVYSLGVLLYELLTGTTPVDKKSLGKAAVLEVLRIVREVEAPRPSAKLSSIDTLPSVAANRGTEAAKLSRLMKGELDWLVMKALEKDRTRRYDTPNGLARDVQRFLADEVIEARPPSVGYRLKKFVRRHKGQFLAASLVLLALALGGGGFLYVKKELDARQAQRIRDVNEAMNAAMTLREQRQLDRAREEAQRALVLVESGPAEAELQDQARSLKAELDKENDDSKLAEHHRQQAMDLGRAGRTDEAIAQGRKSVELDPRNAEAHVMLGALLHAKGQVDETIACWRKAIELDPKNAKTHDNLGVLLHGKGELDEAIACYKKAIELDPKLVNAHANLAAALNAKGQVDEAIACCKKAIELDPNSANAHNNLGAALNSKGQLDEAITYFKKAIAIDPNLAKAHLGLGSSLARKGQWDVAITYLERAIALDPKNAAAHDTLGAALHEKGQVDEAITCFKKAIALDPKYANAHYGLGLALHGKRQVDEAIAYYKKAIELDPKHAKAHDNLGAELADKGQLDEAIACFKKAIELDPKNANSQYNLGVALGKQGKLNEAIACYKKAIALDPKNATVHTNLGAALHRKGQVDEAISCWRKAVELEPKNAKVHSFLGAALHDKGQVDEAIACWRKAIELGHKDAKVQGFLGEVLRRKGQLDEAIACGKKAIALDPKDALAHTNLGAALADKGQLDEAIACFKKTIALDPKLALAHANLGLSLYRKGQLDEAIACLEKALELDPKYAKVHHVLGLTLAAKGQVDEAIACYKKAIALDPKNALARNNLAEAERLAAARVKLPAYRNGSYTPANNEQRLDLAFWCQHEKLHYTATRLFTAAFAAAPKLADDLAAAHRYNAACFSALAAAGQGQDAAKLDDKERTRLRQQAREWLRADLILRSKQLKSGKPADREEVQQALRHWQKDTDLAGIRDAAALAKLPAEERAVCEKLWADVAALLQQTER